MTLVGNKNPIKGSSPALAWFGANMNKKTAPLFILVVIVAISWIQWAMIRSSDQLDSHDGNPSISVSQMTNNQVHDALVQMNLEPLYASHWDADDPWKAQLYQRLDRIRVACGELCQLNTLEAIQQHSRPVPGARHPMVVVPNVNCRAILELEEIDAGDMTVPMLPDELLDYFTLGRAVNYNNKIKKRTDIYLGGESEKALWETGNVWKQDSVNEAVREAAQGTLKGSYGVEAATVLRDKLGQIDMKGKSVLVIGSSHPWVEAIVLYHGAANVTTLEYGKIVSEHPQIETLTPPEFRQKYMTGQLQEFDVVVSHSSIEHSGLGRYGDALNPWGDILAVARAWCVTKKGGYMYMGLPTGRKDLIVSNWHRSYGTIRWPLVATNWRPVEDTDGAELERTIWTAQELGGWGYIFQKESPDSAY